MSYKLKSPFSPSGDQPKAIKKLLEGYNQGYDFMTLLGVTGSGKTFTMANIIQEANKPVLVISPNKILAAQLYREYKSFFPRDTVCYFVSYYDYYQPEAYIPITDTYIDKEAVINEEIDRLRHEATSALMKRKNVIVVASVSCIYNLGTPANYFERAIYLTKEQPLTRGDLLKQLVRLQYQRVPWELKRSKFRVRGDTIEIMPPSEDIIYRVDLSEQKVKDLKILDKLQRKTLEKPEQLVIFPAKHFVIYASEVDRAIKDIKDELKERLAYFKKTKMFLEAERLERRTKNDLAMIKNMGYCNGIENYSRHLAGKLAGEPPETLLSYFPKDKNGKPDFLTIVDESHIAMPQIRGMYEGDHSRKKTLVEYGWRLPSALDNRPLKFEEFLQRVGPVIFTSATPADFEKEKSKIIVEQIIRPTYLLDPKIEIRPVYDAKKEISQIDDLLWEIKKTVQGGERALVNALTKKMSEELAEFLTGRGISARFMHSDTKTLERAEILTDFRRGEFNVLVGVNLLREGLDLPEVSLVAILDADKEGFLRSKTSFIQTMGRAARNLNGKVILYADNLTQSLTNAVREVERRRKIQAAYNKKHGQTPQTIKKAITNLLDLTAPEEKTDKNGAKKFFEK